MSSQAERMAAATRLALATTQLYQDVAEDKIVADIVDVMPADLDELLDGSPLDAVLALLYLLNLTVEHAANLTGRPMNSIAVAACNLALDRHAPDTPRYGLPTQ
jgi:hypothetical protein